MQGLTKKSIEDESHITKTLKENISTVFLLPCLKIREEIKSKFYKFGFINTFMSWDKHESFGNFIPLYLLFEPGTFTIEYYMFCQNLERNQNHVETIDLHNGATIFVFRIPKRFLEDYQTFKLGKYSKFSIEFKSCFPLTRYMYDNLGNIAKDEKGTYKTENTLFYHIFNKTDYMKELLWKTYGEDIELPDELYEVYRPDRETLNY